jgi:hypothetical protein
MSVELQHPSVYREEALNALIEIRACHDELKAFLAGVFDRLDDLLLTKSLAAEAAPAPAESPGERDAMQMQIDQLTRLVSDLARTVEKR